MTTFTVKFGLGDCVYIDGLNDKEGVVTGVTYRSADVQLEVCWWNERSHQSAWFSDWRLTPADQTRVQAGFQVGA